MRQRQADLDEILRPLKGQRCTLVEATYGGGLALGYGDLVELESPSSIPGAEWMLHTRDTNWLVDSSDGVLAVSNGDVSESELARIRQALLETRISDIRVRNSALGLTIRHDSAGTVEVLPDAPDAEGEPDDDLEAWELKTDSDLIVAAYPGRGMRVFPGETPVSMIASQPLWSVEELQLEEPSIAREDVLVRAAPSPRPLTLLRRSLKAASQRLPAKVYERPTGRGDQADFVLITESGQALIVDVKLATHRGGPERAIQVSSYLLSVARVQRGIERRLTERVSDSLLWNPVTLDRDLEEALRALLGSVD